ncbi:MAG: GAF domain-containing protein [Candidatus Omnitrophica bacterium]|nr:GAF domain-containing protein [Candidatus Omnitrophota bacterium]
MKSLAELFYLNWHAVPVALVSTVIFFIGMFIFLQNRKSASNTLFFLICLCVNAWLYGLALMYSSVEPSMALRMYRAVTFLGVSFVSTLVYVFSAVWLRLVERQRALIAVALLGSAFFYFMGLFSPLSFPGVYQYYWGYYPRYGILNQIFILYFFGFFLTAFSNFIQAYLQEKESIRKTQIRLIAIAFFISLTGSVDYLPKLTYIPVYPIGFISVFSWIMLTAYSIVRYKVMDIQTVVHKTLMWLTASSLCGAPAVIVIYLAKNWSAEAGWPPWVFILAASIVFILFALYTRHIQPQIDHWFQRRQWDLMRALENFTDELIYLRSLEEVSAHILKTIRTILYVDAASLLVRDGETERFMIFDSVGKTNARPFGVQNVFLDWLEANDALVIKEYMTIDPRFEAIASDGREYFLKTHSVIAVPLLINERLIAVLNIGKKQNLQNFRSSEINFLTDLRRSAAIALSNSLHLIAMQENLRKWNVELEKKVEERTQQLQQTQAQLVQAEKLATIGTLAGGIAHEINNPLTAVLTNAQILKMMATPDDAESISLIEEGAKRCQVIIQNLLKYARKSMDQVATREVDLNLAVKNVCSLLAYQMKQENVRLTLELQEVPPLEGIANEIEQVLTNLLINARDAVKGPGRVGQITVRTGIARDGGIFMTVADNGVGIEKENLRKVFDPFFTTKEIGTGTGLGLSVSYSLVQKHRGKIEIKSERGMGTEVRVSFPVLKGAVAAV